MTDRRHPRLPEGISVGGALLLAWLVISQFLTLLSLGLWLLAGGFAVLALDDSLPWKAAVIWGYPVFPLVCAIGAWVARHRGRGWLAAGLSGLPILPPLGYLGWLFGG